NEPEASRARLVGQQSLIARLQRPLGRQFIVVPQALHRVLPSRDGPDRDPTNASVRRENAALKRGAGEFYRPIGLLNWPPMSSLVTGPANAALAPAVERELLRSRPRRRSVKPSSKRWQPPE